MKLKKQSLAAGIIVILFSQIIVKIFGFLYRIVLTNIEGFADEGNSYYGSAYKVYIFILAITTTAIPTALSKLIAEKVACKDMCGANRIFKVSLKLFATIGLVFSCFMMFFSENIATNILFNPNVKFALIGLSPAVVIVCMASVFRGYFIGLKNVSSHSISQVIEQIVNSILSIVFVLMLMGKSPEIMAMGSTFATTVSSAVALIYLILYYFKYKDSSIKCEKVSFIQTFDVIKNVLKCVIPISLTSVITSVVGIVDLGTGVKNLTKFYSNFGAVALEIANQKFGIILGKVDVLASIPFSLNAAIVIPLVPSIAESYITSKKSQVEYKINTSLQITNIISMPCFAGLFIMAEYIFSVLYPNATIGVNLMKIQVLGICFALLVQTLTAILTACGKLYISAIIVLVAALTKYILNVIFIPQYGEIVIPITTVIYHMVCFLCAFIAFKKTIKVDIDKKMVYLKPVVSTLIMSITVIIVKKTAVYITRNNIVILAACIITGVAAYALCLAKFGILTVLKKRH